MKPVPVVGLGAGGHAKVVMDILRMSGDWTVVGLLDPKESLWGTEVFGVPVRGPDSQLTSLITEGIRHVFIGLGSTGNTGPRQRLYEAAIQAGLDVVAAIHPAATISPSATIGNGPTIMAGAVVNADAKLGANVIVNTGAVVEHDCIIQDHVHVATGANLASTVHVGVGAHIGLGASVRQCVSIGASSVIGAGAAVVKDVPPGVVMVGVPARELCNTVGDTDQALTDPN